MFIACGDWNKGKIRVMDTSDDTVEEITAEQLKLIQSMGYHIEFDRSKDYIYEFYHHFADMPKAVEILSRFPVDVFEVMRSYNIDFLYDDKLVIYIIYCNSRVVLLSVKQTGRSYKLRIKYDIRSLFKHNTLKGLGLMLGTSNTFSVQYFSNHGKDNNKLVFDFNLDFQYYMD